MPAHNLLSTPLAMRPVLNLSGVLSRASTFSLSYEQSEWGPDYLGIIASTHLMHDCSSLATPFTHPVHGLITVAGSYTHPASLLDVSSADWYTSSALNVEWANLTVKVELAYLTKKAGPVCPVVNTGQTANTATVHPDTVPYATMQSATVHPVTVPSATMQ